MLTAEAEGMFQEVKIDSVKQLLTEVNNNKRVVKSTKTKRRKNAPATNLHPVQQVTVGPMHSAQQTVAQGIPATSESHLPTCITPAEEVGLLPWLFVNFSCQLLCATCFSVWNSQHHKKNVLAW